MHGVVSLVLGGGRGLRLWPLTKHRSEPAVPIAGKYRLIDIPISNCINSGFNRIYVLTQFLSVSLHRHIANTYKFDPFSGGSVEVLAAQQTNEVADWYQGTADAIRQNLRYLPEEDGPDVLVLCGDGLYRMDFRELVHTHQSSGADLTMAVLPVGRAEAPQLGVVRPDDSHRIVDLVEKPQRGEQLEALRPPAGWLDRQRSGGKGGAAAAGRDWLASMGIYVFRRAALAEMLAELPEATDLVTEVFVPNLRRRHLHVHLFRGYWQDLGSIGSYYAANLALAGDEAPFDFACPGSSIYTHMRDLPASQVRGAGLEECLVSDGCVIGSGARLRRCVIGIRTRIGPGAVLRDAIVNGADGYETAAQRAANREAGVPDLGVGEGTLIEGAIVDKGCRIGRGVTIRARTGGADEDGPYYVVREGVVVLPRGTLVPDGTVI
jgi:glucose-1-phosphate adenylyltransferase